MMNDSSTPSKLASGAAAPTTQVTISDSINGGDNHLKLKEATSSSSPSSTANSSSSSSSSRGGKDRRAKSSSSSSSPSSSPSTSKASSSSSKDKASSRGGSDLKTDSPSPSPSPSSREESTKGGDTPASSSTSSSSSSTSSSPSRKKKELEGEQQLRANSTDIARLSKTLGLDTPDIMDYRNFYTFIEARFSKEANPLIYLPLIEEALQAYLSGKLTNEDHIKYLLKTGIPKCVVALLARDELVPKRTRLAELWMMVIRIIVKNMQEDSKELLITLTKLLNPSTYSKDYLYFRTKEREKDFIELMTKYLSEAKAADPKNLPALPKPNEPALSNHYLLLINFFEDIGGFAAIMKRIQSPVQLAMLKDLIRPISYAQDALDSQFLNIYLAELTDLTFARLLEATNSDLSKDEKEDFHDIAGMIQRLLKLIMRQEHIGEKIDRFNLSVGLLGLTSNSLERRLRGLKLIIKNVRAAAPKEEKKPWGMIRSRDQEEKKEKLMIEWLQTNNIIEHLFKLNDHPEIIRQSIDIPQFMATRGLLEPRHLTMLWEATLGKHESVKHVIYTALLELLTCLSSKDIDFLYELINNLSPADCDSESLNFIHNFTISAIVSPLNSECLGKKWYGFEKLWNLVQDDRTLSQNSFTLALELLKRLLRHNVFENHRSSYFNLFIEKCMDNLAKNRSVPQSLELTMYILDTYPKKRKRIGNEKKLSSVIEALEQKCKFVSAFLQDIVKYKETAQEVAASGIRGRFTHQQHITIRLNFLEHVVVNSAITLSNEQLDTLWDCIVTRALNGEEREAFFKWLEKVCFSSKGFVAFDESLSNHLFVNKMSQLDFTTLTMAGFKVFERYLLHINEKNGNLKPIDKKTENPIVDAKSFVVVSPDLVGIDNLWKIALDAQQSAVYQLAISELNTLHQAVGDTSGKGKAGKVREQYIRTAMNHLNVAVEQLQSSTAISSSSSPKQRITRCLILLKTFVEESNSSKKEQTTSGDNRGGSTSSSSREGNQITLIVKVDKGSNFQLSIITSDTIGNLKQKIGETYGRPAEFLHFMANDQELKDDEKTIHELSLSDNQLIVVRSREQEGLTVSNKEKRDDQPKSEPEGTAMSLESVIVEVLNLQLRAIGFSGLPSSFGKKPEPKEGTVESSSKGGALRRMNPLSPRDKKGSAKNVSSSSSSKQRDRGGDRENRDNRDNPNAPSRILAAPEHFDKLYQLLDLGMGLGQQAWQLLNLLPTHDKLLKDITSLKAEHDLSAILNPSKIYKLLYSLKIIENLAGRKQEIVVSERPSGKGKESSSGSSSSQNTNTDDQWREKFVQLGGVKHLLVLLMALDEKKPNAGHQACFALVLKVINLFVTTRDTPAQQSKSSLRRSKFQVKNGMLDTVDLSGLVNKLLEVTWAAANISKVKDGSASPPVPSEDGLEETAPEKLAEFGGEVVKQGMQLLTACLNSNTDMLQQFYKYTRLEEWTLCLLIQTLDRNIRKEAASGIYHLCSQLDFSIAGKKRPADFFVDMLLSFLSQADVYPNSSRQYFQLLDNLLREYEPKGDLSKFDWKELLFKLISSISNHPVMESNSTVGLEDNILIGLMNLVRTLIRKDPTLKVECANDERGNLIRELFEYCLFAIPDAERHGPDAPPKCKTKESRGAAYRLLTELGRGCPANFREITSYLTKQLEIINSAIGSNYWSLVPSSTEKSPYGYVGLQNLGATCYMNSLMQQLYSVPRLRQSLLSVEDKTEPKSESLLYQLQYMFGYLQESAKRFYDTTPFCAACKDCEGKPVNTAQQMDANEFFNMLFDKLENSLKGSPQEHILKEVFGGTLCNQLICKECPHSSEREEPFYSLGVEIKNKEDLYGSLSLFVEGEMLVGDNKYFCDTCNRSVETLKRCCVKYLPNILVVHLKRFEFDFDNMVHRKLNDRCKFPRTLDMEPYTKEGLERREAEAEGVVLTPKQPPEYYQYNLVGIVVHQGTADCGHYYSFIQERASTAVSSSSASGTLNNSNTSSSPSPSTSGEEIQSTPSATKWFEFNDTNVLPFDPHNIGKESFGGDEELVVYDQQNQSYKKITRVKTNNAYILVYERSKFYVPKPKEVPSSPASSTISGQASPITQPSSPVVPASSTSSSLTEPPPPVTDALGGDDESPEELVKNDSKEEEVLFHVDDLTIPSHCKVPEPILRSIWEENSKFFREKYIYNSDYFSFLWNVFNLYSTPSTSSFTTAALTNVTSTSSPNFVTVQLATRYLLEVFARSKEKPMLSLWVTYLKRLYQNNKEFCIWFLQAMISAAERQKQILLTCPDLNIRIAFAEIIATAFQCLAPSERSLYWEEFKLIESISQRSKEKDAPPPVPVPLSDHKSFSILFIETLLSILKDVKRYLRSSQQFFLIFKSFALLGHEERRYLVDRQVITRFLEFFTSFDSGGGLSPSSPSSLTSRSGGPSSPVSKAAATSASSQGGAQKGNIQISGPIMISRPPPNLVHMFELVSILVRSSDTGSEQRPPTQLEGPMIKLSDHDLAVLLGKNFFLKAVQHEVCNSAMKQIAQHFSFENLTNSRFFITSLRDGLMKAPAVGPAFRPFLKLAGALQDIPDTLQEKRIRDTFLDILKVLDSVNPSNNTSVMKTSINFFVKRARKNEKSKHWLLKNKDTLNLILQQQGFKLSI